MSAPHSPGGVSSVSASRSVATMAAACLAWMASTSAFQSAIQPLLAGYWMMTAKKSPASSASHSSLELATLTSMPSGAARVCTTSMVCGCASPAITMVLLLDLTERLASVIASAAAVASSSMEALAIGMPVRSQTMVWKLTSASMRP
ncbi:hypothetical protein SDC9_172807 [bioreactor metagenome]|uniref:Uncharacterized protein n=1 Tax=bioreactor metagenome TaxID=1076179 RepID=A0A645GES2_9ZZZZ